MNSKSLLIAIAALALTATGAQAFSGDMLRRANLTEEQRAAFEVARELQAEGNTEAAKEILLEAGINEEVIERLRSAMAKHGAHQAVHDALAIGDYSAFVLAIAGTPLADIITSEADFERFKEAHDARQVGDRDGAKKIMEELGFPGHKQEKEGRRQGFGLVMQELSDEQREAFLVAKQANDNEAMKAVLVDAGVIEEDEDWMLPKMGRSR